MLLLVGLALRAKRGKHVAIMSVAIAWDVLLVLQIELGREAVAKAVQVAQNSLLLNVHVAMAIATLFLYGAMIYTGRKILGGRSSLRPWHRRLGLTTLGLRLLVYGSSFFLPLYGGIG